MIYGLKKLYSPPWFQGSLNDENYFEGWYFKQADLTGKDILAFIAGISLAEERHAFIQVMDGATGNTEYFRYGLDRFHAARGALDVTVGNSRFTREAIHLDLDNGSSRIHGSLWYRESAPYPSKLLAPGIMGWYSFVPFMECYHGVVSMNHLVDGSLTVDNRKVVFQDGKGYIEKDWGTSFPESWIWLQGNSFQDRNTSFMLSVAKIPWRGSFFVGLLCFLYTGGVLHRFMTYTGAKITSWEADDTAVKLTIRKRNQTLQVHAVHGDTGELIAPAMGAMEERIRESIQSRIMVSLHDRKRGVIFEDETGCAGMEITGSILSLLDR